MLNEAIIKEIISAKSAAHVKFFTSMESSEDIAIVIAALANMDGGYLLFGVQRTLGQNRIVGLAGDFRVDDIMQGIGMFFELAPNYEYGWVKIDDKPPLFVVKVYKSKAEALVHNIRFEMHGNEVVKVEGRIAMDYTKVFIVHGRDNEAKQEVARFIEKLGLDAIILHEQVSRSQTIIEKIEEYSNVGFAVILYTPCDEGRLKGTGNLANRARQNVVFEHGFLMGKIGRNNVCALVKGNVEYPNDISGVVYEDMDNNGAWKLKVAKELKAAGYQIDMNNII